MLRRIRFCTGKIGKKPAAVIFKADSSRKPISRPISLRRSKIDGTGSSKKQLPAAFYAIPQVLIIVLVIGLQPALAAVPVSTPPPNLHNPIIYRPASISNPGTPPFAPADIWKAYNYLPLYSKGIKGNGTRIAIIDAYGDPSLSSDMSRFNSLTNLPSTSINIYYPDGVPKQGDTNWALETALDTEWAHAIAPAATIDLVIGLDNSLQHLYNAIQYVVNNLPQETTLSMSWGDYESNYPSTGSYTIANTHQLFLAITGHGTAVFASSGDQGAVGCCFIQYPASDPLVIGVGGTSLHLDANASYSNEQAWSGSTAGSSIIFPKPAWQQALGDAGSRDSVDVSYDGDPNTGVLVVQGGLEYRVGGTSVGAPQWAGLIALASQANSQTYAAINAKLYTLTSYHDILTGSDGYFSSGSGWDYPTGLGTPDAYATVSALSPGIPLNINETETFQGVNVTTSANLNIAQSTGKLSGTALVLARNSTTGAVLLNKTYTLTSLQLQNRAGILYGAFLFTIPATNYPLSSDVRVTDNSGTASATVTVTRSLDVNGDGIVNIIDLAFVASLYGSALNTSNYDGRADADANGTINILDLAYVAAFFDAPDYI